MRSTHRCRDCGSYAVERLPDERTEADDGFQGITLGGPTLVALDVDAPLCATLEIMRRTNPALARRLGL